jgi:hypothetical protein
MAGIHWKRWRFNNREIIVKNKPIRFIQVLASPKVGFIFIKNTYICNTKII